MALRATSFSACSWDVELALKEEEWGTVGVLRLDSDVILEGGSEAWHIEAERGQPLLTDLAGGCGAVTVVVALASASAGVDGVVGNGTSEFALEGDGSEVDVLDVPDATDVELLSALGADGGGIGSSVLGEEDKVLLSWDLGDDNVVILVLLLFGVVNSLGFNHWRANLGGGEGGEGGASELLHVKNIIIIELWPISIW